MWYSIKSITSLHAITLHDFNHTIKFILAAMNIPTTTKDFSIIKQALINFKDFDFSNTEERHRVIFDILKTKTGDKNFYDYIDEILNPVTNEFELKHYNNDTYMGKNVSSEISNEVWTSGECLLIKEELLNNIS
jgi:hypothetical protein